MRTLVPTMKFRWLIKRNKVTREMVEEYRTEHGTTLMESARILRDETDRTLQQWFEFDRTSQQWFELLDGWGAGEWCDVPTEVEEHEVAQ